MDRGRSSPVYTPVKDDTTFNTADIAACEYLSVASSCDVFSLHTSTADSVSFLSLCVKAILTLWVQGDVESSWAPAKTNNPTDWKQRSICERERGGRCREGVKVVERKGRIGREKWLEAEEERACPEMHAGQYTDLCEAVWYWLQRFRCDYSERLKFLCSTGLTARLFFFLLSITLNLSFHSFPRPILISPFLKHLGTPEKYI